LNSYLEQFAVNWSSQSLEEEAYSMLAMFVEVASKRLPVRGADLPGPESWQRDLELQSGLHKPIDELGGLRKQCEEIDNNRRNQGLFSFFPQLSS
jgi:hypothetical protein